MSVSRIKNWIAETLTASDLNAEFNNILSNGEDLAWPATKAKDLNGQELILDADADSSITADTDDRIDVKLAGIDLFRFDGTTTTPVNGLDFVASAAGSDIAINAVGSDTDINIDLVPKGSGVLLLDGAPLGFTLGTEQSTSSGSSVTFGSIPAGTKQIIIMFDDVSMTNTAKIDVVIGDAGGLELTGYVSTSHAITDTTVTSAASIVEFIMDSRVADNEACGHMTLTLEDSANNTWVSSHTLCDRSTTTTIHGAGRKALSAELTQVRIGGGTFDAGAINIMYQ